ncbi:hypothetical protein C8R47DRAFT_1208175 [Mycena vitilis]|nr:hypothetical protein C8R47DRAFT_1208175 [Mycena vitilis]
MAYASSTYHRTICNENKGQPHLSGLAYYQAPVADLPPFVYSHTPVFPTETAINQPLDDPRVPLIEEKPMQHALIIHSPPLALFPAPPTWSLLPDHSSSIREANTSADVVPAPHPSQPHRKRDRQPRVTLAPDQPPTKQGNPRARVYVACTRCRTMKIRCNGAKPVCHTCSKHPSAPESCEYDPLPQRRGPDRVPGARPSRVLNKTTGPTRLRKPRTKAKRSQNTPKDGEGGLEARIMPPLPPPGSASIRTLPQAKGVKDVRHETSSGPSNAPDHGEGEQRLQNPHPPGSANHIPPRWHAAQKESSSTDNDRWALSWDAATLKKGTTSVSYPPPPGQQWPFHPPPYTTTAMNNDSAYKRSSSHGYGNQEPGVTHLQQQRRPPHTISSSSSVINSTSTLGSMPNYNEI